MERYAHGEAPEEASAFVLLDACNGVEFQEQPARIEFDWYGGPTTHLPDILVAAGATKEFWECKKDHEAKDFLVRKRAERLRELLLPLGFGYRLVTTRDLAQRSYYPNAIAMRRFAKELGYNPEWIKAPSSIHGLQELPANEALSFVPEAQRLQALNSLLYSGHLRAQMCNPVTLSTPVLHVDPAKESNPWVWELFERTK